MIITLSPVRMDVALTASLAGEVLTLNGTDLDLSALAEGGNRALPETVWLSGPVTRQGGVLHVPLILPHGATPPEETRFPALIHMTKDGPVPLPPYDTAEV